jgi:hypothetical protein
MECPMFELTLLAFAQFLLKNPLDMTEGNGPDHSKQEQWRGNAVRLGLRSAPGGK